jgi:predicted SAM-dependent methyltransferase
LQDAPLRLHLGCGEKYFDGYVNIDYPPEMHSVLSSPADVHADITELSYELGSVTEVRLHHVFEHFDRPTTLRLLIDWYGWLQEGGTLVIETPNFEAAVRRFLKRRFRSSRGTVLRHIFGSHEASWAFHADGWYEEKFRRVLGALGYEIVSVDRESWRSTDNITVTARKPTPPWRSREALLERAERILLESLVDNSASERRLYRVWVDSLRRATG